VGQVAAVRRARRSRSGGTGPLARRGKPHSSRLSPPVGPAGFRCAVTGGTGTYEGASGEAIGTFRPDTDTVDIQVHLD